MKNTIIKPPENGAIDPYFYIIRKGDDSRAESSTESDKEEVSKVTERAIDPVALLTGESFWSMISTQYFPIIQTFKM